MLAVMPVHGGDAVKWMLTGLVLSLSLGGAFAPAAHSQTTPPEPTSSDTLSGSSESSDEKIPPETETPDTAATPSASETSSQSDTPAATAAPLAAADVTAEQVEQLARSLLAIQPLLVEANEDILQATSPDEQQAIEETFEAEAADIIEQQGLTVDTYQQMLVLANGDTEFKQRIAQQLDELQSDAATQSPEAE